MSVVTLLSCLLFVNPSIAGYVLEDDYSPSNFFDMFSFWTSSDPTHGFVDYVDQSTAQDSGLISVNDGSVYMGVDYENVTPNGRPSVRLTSNKAYNSGSLVILDLEHMPGGICGTWPAFWMVGPNWPNGGEIDIIEGVNQQLVNDMTLHTATGCEVTNNGNFSGILNSENCDANVNGNQGCQIASQNPASYGDGFNAANGGVYATEWTDDAISIWFFARGSIPSDISNGNPDPSGWATPMAQFTGCDIPSFFQDQQIVFDNTFCGDWAGNVWSSSTCAAKADSCEAFVENNPSAFKDSYWTINALKVYQYSEYSKTDAASTTPAVEATSAVYVPISSETTATSSEIASSSSTLDATTTSSAESSSTVSSFTSAETSSSSSDVPPSTSASSTTSDVTSSTSISLSSAAATSSTVPSSSVITTSSSAAPSSTIANSSSQEIPSTAASLHSVYGFPTVSICAAQTDLCPSCNGAGYQKDGNIMNIACNMGGSGRVLGAAARLHARDTQESFQLCIAECSAASGCVAAAYVPASLDCVLYTSVAGVYAQPGTQFAYAYGMNVTLLNTTTSITASSSSTAAPIATTVNTTSSLLLPSVNNTSTHVASATGTVMSSPISFGVHAVTTTSAALSSFAVSSSAIAIPTTQVSEVVRTSVTTYTAGHTLTISGSATVLATPSVAYFTETETITVYTTVYINGASYPPSPSATVAAASASQSSSAAVDAASASQGSTAAVPTIQTSEVVKTTVTTYSAGETVTTAGSTTVLAAPSVATITTTQTITRYTTVYLKGYTPSSTTLVVLPTSAAPWDVAVGPNDVVVEVQEDSTTYTSVMASTALPSVVLSSAPGMTTFATITGGNAPAAPSSSAVAEKAIADNANVLASHLDSTSSNTTSSNASLSAVPNPSGNGTVTVISAITSTVAAADASVTPAPQESASAPAGWGSWAEYKASKASGAAAWLKEYEAGSEARARHLAGHKSYRRLRRH
ncbi:hypothetical protein H2203_008182 [Taxawa tesnikishii (nom. ined.)]|nr:hypothetical protein H2203_008182 [Dothideales sp. JES 119]